MTDLDDLITKHGYMRIERGYPGGPGIRALYVPQDENQASLENVREWFEDDELWQSTIDDVAGERGPDVRDEHGRPLPRTKILLVRRPRDEDILQATRRLVDICLSPIPERHRGDLEAHLEDIATAAAELEKLLPRRTS